MNWTLVLILTSAFLFGYLAGLVVDMKKENGA